MKKVATFLAGAVSVVLVAMLLPASVFANCPNFGQVQVLQCYSGDTDFPQDVSASPLFGTAWIQGAGNPAQFTGIDTGPDNATGLGGSQADFNWIQDIAGDPQTRCIVVDWGDARMDGCPTSSSTPVWVVVSDSFNHAMAVSVLPTVTPEGLLFDLATVSNGTSGIFGVGLAVGRAVHVDTASTSVSSVSVNVAALSLPVYSETGSRTLPGVQLRGKNSGLDTIQAGSGAHSIVVDKDSDLCWDVVDAGFTAPLGCVRIGGLTPSQNLQNAKATLGKGQVNFSWDVSAQFDVLGFNIIQKNATKGTERAVNSTLIPISGMNDAQAASYKFSAGRNDLQATRGGFEIEMVRTNGETSRTPVPLIVK